MNDFNAKNYLTKMLDDKKKFIQIIAIFALGKNYSFDNLAQVQWFIGRNAKVAKRMECFELEKIKQTLQWLKETVDYKITLETVEKYIMETPKKKDDAKPIITLKSGEEIYDIKRLSELEQTGIITYNARDKKWFENV
jgi:hypothetical protein